MLASYTTRELFAPILWTVGKRRCRDEAAVSRLLSIEEVIPAMEHALADFSSGEVVQPVRKMLQVAGGALGAKLVTFYPQNQGIPTHHATILLFKLRPASRSSVWTGIGSPKYAPPRNRQSP